MSYQALYRVWRPQSFEDVVGQEHITKTIQNALMQDKLSHAYLFSGPRGTGKTSAAKIIAKAVNCERAPVSEPCNECDACIGITNGTISDVLEIDAASNTGVDDIRDIRDKVKFAPSSVTYKVYIIDEVHMLSTGAFNALLKTLEEPPSHVIFILATTEPHKIPATIVSRCQRFDFKRISSQSIIGRMKKVVDANGTEVEEDALQLLARAAEGGMRDALSLLDQAISYSDDKVRVEDVLSVTGSASQKHLSDMAEAFLAKDVSKALTISTDLLQEGKDPVRFLGDLIYYYRDMLLYKAAPQLEELLERVSTDESFERLASSTETENIYSIISQLNQAQQEMKWTNHPKIFLETTFIKICYQKQAGGSVQTEKSSVEPLLQRIEKLEQELSKMKQGGWTQSGAPGSSEQEAPKEKRVIRTQGGASHGQVKEMLKKAKKQNLVQLKGMWGEILDRIRSEKVSAYALLSGAEPVACSDQIFLLSFQHEIHRQMASQENNRSYVEGAVYSTIGKNLSMLSILDPEWQKLKAEFIKEQQQGQPSSEEQEKKDDPLITEAIKLVGDDLIEIKEEDNE
ncbi:DNA polymerase III subunit gamma/tau [Fictibacillus phosphorivorans]|uniref:DNA polymerase III subunit gamma/tau n=1 Tax=Fictibacillus phosphorivorans TaxID=1221500 RepID=UPI00203C8E8A|nr:DNA polymerase III subunit gamma/tau [Fictibacillus phosphorivorans]MCM3720283.1 DNA polymerase III subunit gamma/tau [Fictibacillus phosphorivorans]MCM3777973.1 DNA polymerase III subunit gamma/tau [Fictibacillus phosphorivorans]